VAVVEGGLVSNCSFEIIIKIGDSPFVDQFW